VIEKERRKETSDAKKLFCSCTSRAEEVWAWHQNTPAISNITSFYFLFLSFQ
jgi:hypothetical protein